MHVIQLAHEEDVDHGEERLHGHLQHHGDAQQQDRPAHTHGGVVLVLAAAQAFADGIDQAMERHGVGGRS